YGYFRNFLRHFGFSTFCPQKGGFPPSSPQKSAGSADRNLPAPPGARAKIFEIFQETAGTVRRRKPAFRSAPSRTGSTTSWMAMPGRAVVTDALSQSSRE